MEYLLGVLMIVGGINTSMQTPASAATANIFAVIMSGPIALYLFSVVVFVLGVLLIYGKIRDHDRLRSNVLYWIYVLMLFATLSDIVSLGILSFAWLDSVILGIWAMMLHGRLNIDERRPWKELVKWTHGTMRVAHNTRTYTRT